MLPKSDRIKGELSELTVHNKKLSDILKCLDQYCQVEFKKEITVTSVLRTQAEQDALYKEVPVDKRPKSSPHLTWRAADIRSTDFDDAQIKRMLSFLNCFSYTSGQGRPVALYHTIAGNVFHFHIQAD